mmetsp:Transcript_14224/g.14209  ORF Transcript_14224/g.14209 Transcript_14224/m.14209 type:complete len:92 (+) Transcript_14224:117-392(+)
MKFSGSRNKLITVLHSQVLQKGAAARKGSASSSKGPPSKEEAKPCQNPEQEPEPSALQQEYIDQLKDNNKVLKDLIRNKNKEIVSLEMTIK